MTNDQLIYETAIRAGFTPTAAKLVVAQARFESADYTSSVFKNNNNTSGMKFIGQPLATRGTLAPMNERSQTCRAGGECKNSDHYARFASVADSAADKINRLYSRTMGGVTPDQLKNAKDADEFAALLKRRSYYGFGGYGTETGNKEQRQYAAGLRAKLLRLQVVEFVRKNKVPIAVVAVAAIGISFLMYRYFRNK
jgi:hypothetical protein